MHTLKSDIARAAINPIDIEKVVVEEIHDIIRKRIMDNGWDQVDSIIKEKIDSITDEYVQEIIKQVVRERVTGRW